MVVRDDHARPLHVRQHVARNEFAAAVVALRVFRQEDTEAVPDRDPGRHDQEAAREVPAAGTADRVHRLPGDQHGHDRGLAGAGRHLEGNPEEFGVCDGVRVVEMVPEAAQPWRQIRPRIPERPGDLHQPDRGLGRLDLAEERTEVRELVAAPVAE